jgi:uncharacterized protein DUF1707
MPSGPSESVPLRASDAEREKAAALLREAAAERRIDLEELAERLALVSGARIQPELETVLEDLPARDAGLAAARPQTAARWSVAVIGNEVRSGRWRPGESSRALALVGDCTLDLRQAEVEGMALQITAIALVGDVRVIVPPGVAVELDGIAVIGSKKYELGEAPEPPSGAPRVRVNGYAVIGDVILASEPPLRGLDRLRARLQRLRQPPQSGSAAPEEEDGS